MGSVLVAWLALTPGQPPAMPVEFAGRPLKFWLDELASESLLRKEEALAVLAELGPAVKETLPAVEKYLTAKQPSLRKRAAVAVWKIGGNSRHAAVAYAEELKHDDRVRQYETMGLLQKMGADAAPGIPTMLAALPELTRTGNLQTFQTLIRTMGKAAVPGLLDALGSPDAAVRGQALVMLSQLGPVGKDAVPALEARLADASAAVRVRSAWALWQLGTRTDREIGVFVKDSANADADLRGPVVHALLDLAPYRKEFLATYKLGLVEADPVVKARAADAVWELEKNADAVVPVLVEVLKLKSDPWARWRQAVPVLAKVGPAAKPALPLLLERFKSQEWAEYPPVGVALVNVGGADLIEPLFAVLEAKQSPFVGNPNAALHPRSALALGLLGEPALKAAVARLDSPDPEVRRAACEVLGHFGPAAKDVAEKLVGLLKDESRTTRYRAGVALRNLGPEVRRVEKQLIAAAGSADVDVRALLCELLTRHGTDKKAMAEIGVKMLGEELANVRCKAVELLWTADPKSPEIEPALRKILAGDPTRAVWAIRTVGTLGAEGKPFVPDLAKRLADRTPRDAADICKALGDLGEHAKEAVPALIDTLTGTGTPDVLLAAADALNRIGAADKRMVAALAKIAILPGSPRPGTARPRKPAEHYPALELLAKMKGDAAEVVPQLRAALDRSAAAPFTTHVAETLLAIDPEGTKTVTLPHLKSHLQLRPGGYSPRAFEFIPAIWTIEPDSKDVLDFLRKTAADPQNGYRDRAVVGLVELGIDPKTYADSVKTLVTDARALARSPALAHAAWRVTGDAGPSVVALLTAAHDRAHREREAAVRFLGRMGPAAKAAVPDLLFLSWGSDYQLRPVCEQALVAIDPATAARFHR